VLPAEDEGDEASADSAGDEASADNADSAKDANARGSMSWMDDKDYRSFCAFYKSPSKPTIVVVDDVEAGKGKNVLASSDGSSEDESDEDYVQPLSKDSSVEDEEAQEMRKFAYELKRRNRAKKLGIHGVDGP